MYNILRGNFGGGGDTYHENILLGGTPRCMLKEVLEQGANYLTFWDFHRFVRFIEIR